MKPRCRERWRARTLYRRQTFRPVITLRRLLPDGHRLALARHDLDRDGNRTILGPDDRRLAAGVPRGETGTPTHHAAENPNQGRRDGKALATSVCRLRR